VTAQPADSAAVALSGEAFTVVAVLFVAAMLFVVFLRARAKSRAARTSSRLDRNGGDGGYGAEGSDSRRSEEAGPDTDGGGDGGSGNGGGGGD
jgi:hypothetical protein